MLSRILGSVFEFGTHVNFVLEIGGDGRLLVEESLPLVPLFLRLRLCLEGYSV